MYEFSQDDRRRGGIASGETRRRKKTLRETAQTLLAMEAPDNIVERFQELGMEKGDTFQTAIALAMLNDSMSGKSTAPAMVSNLVRLLGEDVTRFELSTEFDESAQKLDEWFQEAQKQYAEEHKNK